MEAGYRDAVVRLRGVLRAGGGDGGRRMRLSLNPNSIDDYRKFLRIKSLPRFAFRGTFAEVPDEYAAMVGAKPPKQKPAKYEPLPGLFDYQAAVSRLAIRKRKFAAFMGCGLGKTLVMAEFVRHARSVLRSLKSVLIVSPLMVVRQTIGEFQRFYGDTLPVEQVRAKDLHGWLSRANVGSGRIGITNYEAITDDLPSVSNLGALVLDESSMLKSHYGKWGTRLIEMGKGLDWKLCLTGTPAPNDRIEYANHAVFLDHFPTVNSFLARFFVNRGQTDNRWELKPHALRPFYRALSHWCIFLSNPAVYGWRDNVGTIPPVRVHIHDVDLTDEQQQAAIEGTGALFASAGGITSRAKLAQIAKGRHNGEDIETLKPESIRSLVNAEPDRPTIIWCKYNPEQDAMAELFPDAANISGDTPEEKRAELIADFQQGRRNVLISKPKIIGFGLNLQRCTRMVFSTLQDSYEEYHQAVARASRIGATRPLDVHIPITEIERPMVETVLRKARQIDADTAEQERIFKEVMPNV